MDVSPRTLTVGAPEETPPSRPRRPRNARAWLLAGIVLAALGFVVFRGLGNATLFFYNVDEAVAKQESLGTSRFRLQGSVVPGSVSRSDLGADFTITLEGGGESLWAESNVAAAKTVHPRVAASSTAGASLATAGIYKPLHAANERVEIVVAQGGNTKQGTFYVKVV